MKKTFAVASLLALSLASNAYADREDIRLLAETKISLVDAIKAAESHQGGKAVDAGLDDDSFKPTYEVSVVKDDRLYDVRVDAVSGEVIGAREDIDD